MKLLTRTEAEKATAEFHEMYVSAHMTAWDRWSDHLTKDPEFFEPLADASTRFQILNRHIVSEVEKAIPNTIRVPGGLPTLFHVIDGKATVRFKHLNGRDLKPIYNSTERQDRLMEQAYTGQLMNQLQLAGVDEPLTALICGYRLTPGEDAIAEVVIACHTPTLIYHFPLTGGEGAEMLSFPTIEPPQPRVISRIVEEQQEQTDTGRS